MNTLNEFEQFQQDLRVYGEQAAIDMAALRQRIAQRLSVSRESSEGRVSHVTPSYTDPRPQVGPSEIHGADKPLTNMKDFRSFLD